MALSTYVGSFNIDTTKTAGQTQAVAGVGFTPKVVLFFWSGFTGTGDSVAGGSLTYGVGAMSGASSRWSTNLLSADNANPSVCYTSKTDAGCIRIYSAQGTLDGMMDFSSFDADGFTLAVDDQFETAYRIQFLAIGGTDLTNVALGEDPRAGSLGNTSISDLAFQPDAIFFAQTRLTGAGSQSENDAGIGYGMSTGASDQGTLAILHRNGLTTSDTKGYAYSGEVKATCTSGGPSVRDALVSFDANGFTINQIEGTGLAYYFYVALEGPQFKFGSVTTATDGTEIKVTGLPFQPSAILFMSEACVLDTQNVGHDHVRFSIGAATSSSSRFCVAVSDEDNVSPTETARANYESEVYAFIADDATTGLMDLVSIESDGFTCVMDNYDPIGNAVFYLAIGPANAESASASPSVSPSISASASLSASPSRSPSVSPSVSRSTSASLSASPSRSPSASASPSASHSVSPSVSPSVAIAGSICWGHVTGVTQDNARTFADHWSGTGTIVGAGDSEYLSITAGQYMESEVVDTGARLVMTAPNQYLSGDTPTTYYRTGTSDANCRAASWTAYTVPFNSQGYVQIRLEI